MAEPTLRFNNVKTVLNNKNSKGANAYQSKKYPTAYILYTTLAELPDSLSDNALIFTTDTAELFVGTGSGIQRIKLGTEADLNPRLFLKILEAKEIYKNKLEAEQDKAELQKLIHELEDSVYSKKEIDDFITKDIDFDGVIDKLNLYTINKVNDLLAEKAASVDVYTQAQTNDLIDATKQEASDNLDTYKTEAAETYATIVDAATKTELSEKETEIRNFVVEDYLSKSDASSTYTTIEKVDNLESDINSKIETANASIEANTSEISNIKSSYVKADDYASDKESIEASIEAVEAATKNAVTESIMEAAIIDAVKDKADKIDLTSVSQRVAALEKKEVYTKAEVDAAIETAITNVLQQIREEFKI